MKEDIDKIFDWLELNKIEINGSPREMVKFYKQAYNEGAIDARAEKKLLRKLKN